MTAWLFHLAIYLFLFLFRRNNTTLSSPYCVYCLRQIYKGVNKAMNSALLLDAVWIQANT